MTTPTKPPNSSRPALRLVQHDIHLSRERSESDRSQVVARVTCERRGCEVLVEQCAHCERFARIETHEAGYVLLCRAHDEQLAPECAEAPTSDES